MNRVSVIIPNYNGKHFLKPCLEALKNQSMTDFEIVVVDNGSSDGSVEMIKDSYPEIRLIAFEENTGFCKAVNEGVGASDCEYVLLLNNDTVPFENLVEELYKAIDSKPKAFACASCMLTVSDNTILDGAGDLYNALGWAFARGKGRKASDFNREQKVFSVCAGAAIYRRKLFVELGMLDENHFAYLEDLDLCYRAKIQGYENWYIPSAKVVHVGSGTTGSAYNEFKVRLSSRNNVYIIYKNMPAFQRILNAPFLAAGFAVKRLYFKRKGFGEIYAKGLKEGKKFAKSDEGRKRRQKFRLKYLKNYFSIQIELWINMFKRR